MIVLVVGWDVLLFGRWRCGGLFWWLSWCSDGGVGCRLRVGAGVVTAARSAAVGFRDSVVSQPKRVRSMVFQALSSRSRAGV